MSQVCGFDARMIIRQGNSKHIFPQRHLIQALADCETVAALLVTINFSSNSYSVAYAAINRAFFEWRLICARSSEF